MSEKGTRRVRCGNQECSKALEFKVDSSMYNTVKQVRCPACKTVGRVTIPRPPQDKPRRPSTAMYDEELSELFKELWSTPGGRPN